MAKNVKLPKVNKDHYARTSFLFQAAHLHLKNGNPILARSMARNMDIVAKRTVLKLLPYVKRSMCKKCHMLLVPGLSMSVHIENLLKNQLEKADVMVVECNQCSTTKRFPFGKNREFELFCDRPGVRQG